MGSARGRRRRHRMQAARARDWGSPSRSSPALMSPVSFFAILSACAARTCLPWPPAERWYASILLACPCVPFPFSCHRRPPFVPVRGAVDGVSPLPTLSGFPFPGLEHRDGRLLCPLDALFSFSWWCFSACSAPGTPGPSPPGVWGLCGAAVTKGSLVMRSTLVLPSCFLRCELKTPVFLLACLDFSSFSLSGGGKKKKKKKAGLSLSKIPQTDPKGKGLMLAAEHPG